MQDKIEQYIKEKDRTHMQFNRYYYKVLLKKEYLLSTDNSRKVY